MNRFVKQVFRKDVLTNMLSNIKLDCDVIFNCIMENKSTREKGFIYETICQILVLSKCITGLEYTTFLEGKLEQELTPIQNIKSLLNGKIHGGGDSNNNAIDMAIKKDDTLFPFTIKYRQKYCDTDTTKIDTILSKNSIYKKYKIVLIVKDKNVIISHKYKDNKCIIKKNHDTVIKNGLIFDENDIKKGMIVFCNHFRNTTNIDDFINTINSKYLLSHKIHLVKKLHQEMTVRQFIVSLSKENNMMCISHKPRSGKSIIILLICKYLLQNGYKKILIMTSVPDTLKGFTNDLDKYIDFENILYKNQHDINDSDTFTGIVFCSVQYLKTLRIKKMEMLKKNSFDAIFVDECHQGSSTYTTKTEILEVDSVEKIRRNIKLNVFVSGTSTKTEKYYNIHNSCVYKWDLEDESYMKQLNQPSSNIDVVKYMNNRHGKIFEECINDNTLNTDYSKHPVQVLMKYSISTELIDKIKAYNNQRETKFGYSCSSLFALQQCKNDKGDVEYTNEFDICKTVDGVEILKGFLDSIISNDYNKHTIMKQIEITQTSKNSRKSTFENPLLFIFYLPTHTRNNTIDMLQKALADFLKSHKLWTGYKIAFSNSKDDSSSAKKEYNKFIEDIMIETKREKKRGCILLLGTKGCVGITYKHCDVTISLDDGHNLDNQKQRFSRALTEADGKTIGINVDMNIQRLYSYLIDTIGRYRKNTKSNMSNYEILYYLYSHNVFLFNPQYFNNGNTRQIDITSYYKKESENIINEIDDTPLLENIVCNDDMRKFIISDFRRRKSINIDLQGDQPDCPKGDKSMTEIDPPDNERKKQEKGDIPDEKIENIINQTYEMCKGFMFPLLSLLSRIYKINDFKDIFIKQKVLLFSLLQSKIELNDTEYDIITNIMSNIIDENTEIVNVIREIYSTAPSHKIRNLIERHFIPTPEEQKQNAEVSTPVVLVDEMLDKVPIHFWKSPKKVFEPCCGKGNFVLGIFDRFYKGLENIVDPEERCKEIIKCIYYADISPLNTFITTELLKCHITSYCGDEQELKFNFYTGDTLKLDVEHQWKVKIFDLVVGNPPYSTDPSNSNTKPLYNKFIEKYINNDYLLFVVPSRWFVGGKGLDSFRNFMVKRRDIVFIRHEENSKKWFNNVVVEGGVNYFLKDSNYNGLCLFNDLPYDLSKYDCIIHPKYHTLVDNIINIESISKLYKGRFFKVETNDKRFREEGKIKCYVSLQKSKNRYKYLESYDFNDNNTFWKVVTARANGKNPNFGVKFVGKPDEIHTGSYISFRVNTEDEAQSLLSYLDTKFANHMLSIRKISQDISENTCKWIPLVPLDRTWNDEKVCEYLNIRRELY